MLSKLTARLLFASVFVLTAGMPTANAQSMLPGPVRWIVGYPPGGGADFIARTVAVQLSKELGQTVIIENKPGGNTFIAVQAAASARPDGMTLLFADNGTLVNNKALFAKLPYDIGRDFAPVSMLHRIPIVLVANPSFPASTYPQLVELAKKQPKTLNYGTPGQGSPHHLAVEMLMERAGFSLADVPYKGGAPAVQDTVGGQIPLLAGDAAFTQEFIKSGKLKGIVTLTESRTPALPDVPSLGDYGIRGLDMYAWAGVLVPKATPLDIVMRLNAAFVNALANPEVVKKLRDIGSEPMSSTPEALTQRIERESAIWQPLIKSRGIQLN